MISVDYVEFYGDFVLKSLEVALCRDSKIFSPDACIWM
jgi:hypothetical protein